MAMCAGEFVHHKHQQKPMLSHKHECLVPKVASIRRCQEDHNLRLVQRASSSSSLSGGRTQRRRRHPDAKDGAPRSRAVNRVWGHGKGKLEAGVGLRLPLPLPLPLRLHLPPSLSASLPSSPSFPLPIRLSVCPSLTHPHCPPPEYLVQRDFKNPQTPMSQPLTTVLHDPRGIKSRVMPRQYTSARPVLPCQLRSRRRHRQDIHPLRSSCRRQPS